MGEGDGVPQREDTRGAAHADGTTFSNQQAATEGEVGPKVPDDVDEECLTQSGTLLNDSLSHFLPLFAASQQVCCLDLALNIPFNGHGNVHPGPLDFPAALYTFLYLSGGREGPSPNKGGYTNHHLQHRVSSLPPVR
jgi:hypothetical protein